MMIIKVLGSIEEEKEAEEDAEEEEGNYSLVSSY